MDHEDAFAEEAQEEALLSEGSTDRGAETQYRTREDEEDENESSPLMSPRRRRTQKTPYSRASASYQRAINEPWSGAHGSHALPWYKKPTVWSFHRTPHLVPVAYCPRSSGSFLHSSPSV